MKKKNSYVNLLLNLFFIVISAMVIIPLLYIISASLTPQDELAKYGFKLIPHKITFIAFKYLFNNSSLIIDAYKVSIMVTVIGAILSVIVTSMLAYTLSRKDFLLNRILNKYVVFTMLFSGGLVSWYMLIVNYLQLKNSIWALILPYVAIPWHIFLMRGFMKDLPTALFESAKIDGASELRIYYSIVLPLSKPALATIGLFSAFIYWNDWWLSMLFIEKQSLYPIQLLLYSIMKDIEYVTSMSSTQASLSSSNLPTEAVRMAICILAAAPMMIVFPFFQKYFVKGLVVGAVKE